MNWWIFREAVKILKAFIIIIGGRGIGKTYSVLTFLIEEGKPFIYLRNTDVQLKESCTAAGNPFKRWNRDHGTNIVIEKEQNHGIIYDKTTDEPKFLGYAYALSTFINYRGADLSDVIYVLFDEFIEKRKLSFRQFEVFMDFYETVNRNRELLGEAPLTVIMLSNSQKLDNPILAGFNLITQIERMLQTGQQNYSSPDLFLSLPKSAVSEEKRNTAQYRLASGTKYAKEVLDNTFAFDSFYAIQKRPIREYVALCSIDDIYIYRHKSNGKYYASHSQATNIPEYSSRDNLTAFMRSYGRHLIDAASNGSMEFENFLIKSKLFDILT